MTTPNRLPLLLLPGLINDARLWLSQVSQLSDIADARVGDLTVADTIPALAAAALAQAPAERFALAGLSMGGYVAMEIMRQAPERVLALALLDTSARADTEEATEGRRKAMALAETDFPAVIAALLPKMVHPSQLNDPSVGGVFKAMAYSVGKEAFLASNARSSAASTAAHRSHGLPAPPSSFAGATTRSLQWPCTKSSPPRSPDRAWRSSRIADTSRRWASQSRLRLRSGSGCNRRRHKPTNFTGRSHEMATSDDAAATWKTGAAKAWAAAADWRPRPRRHRDRRDHCVADGQGTRWKCLA